MKKTKTLRLPKTPQMPRVIPESGPTLVALLVASTVLVFAGLLASYMSRTPPHATGDKSELPFFPSGRFVEILSLGQPTAMADIAWLQAIQYYGKHHLGDRRYPLAAHLFDITTRCDPRFRSAYLFGALVLGEEGSDMDGARDLMARGIAANPGDWMLPFHRGFLEYMHGDPGIGAVEMSRAARIDGAPAYASRLAAHACARAGKRELAMRLWEEMARSGDAGTRAVAEERLRTLRAGGAS